MLLLATMYDEETKLSKYLISLFQCDFIISQLPPPLFSFHFSNVYCWIINLYDHICLLLLLLCDPH